jgi:hypothetical protein
MNCRHQNLVDGSHVLEDEVRVYSIMRCSLYFDALTQIIRKLNINHHIYSVHCAPTTCPSNSQVFHAHRQPRPQYVQTQT